MTAGDRRQAAVLGSPIGHSLSPALHAAAYAALGLDWSYDAIECTRAALPDLLERLAPTHAGLSLTMPLKQAVLPLLDECDELARDLGAVNTVVYDGARRLGFNTDVAGVLAAFDELRALGVDVTDQPVALLGAGGAARAVVAALGLYAAGPVTIVVRSPDRAQGVLELAARRRVVATAAPWAPGALAGVSAVLSAVPPAPETADLVGGGWPAGAACFDLVYAPWPTELAAAATAAGVPVVGGLTMLLAQAAEQVRLMTGRSVPLSVLRAAADAAIAGG